MANRPEHGTGYIPHGYRWMAACQTAPLTQLQRWVWLEVGYQWLGFARRDVVLLSPTELARRTGRSKGSVGSAIGDLVDFGMLRRLDGVAGRYEPEGDPAAWHFGETPKAREARLAYINESFRLAKAIRPLEPEPDLPGPPPAGKQQSFLDDRPGTPPAPADHAERSAIAERQGGPRSDNTERRVLLMKNERSGNTERRVLLMQNDPPRAIEERPRDEFRSKKELRVFVDAEPGTPEPPEAPGKKNAIFVSGSETPEELVALFERHRGER